MLTEYVSHSDPYDKVITFERITRIFIWAGKVGNSSVLSKANEHYAVCECCFMVASITFE